MSLRHKVDSDIGGYYRVWSSVRVSPSSVSSRQDLCIDFFQVAVHLCFWSDDNELSQVKKKNSDCPSNACSEKAFIVLI